MKANQYYDLLAKMFNGEIVKQADVQEFKGSLEAHQNVTGMDGYTVLNRALIEHNIVVISRIYMNITFKELGNFLITIYNKCNKTDCFSGKILHARK